MVQIINKYGQSLGGTIQIINKNGIVLQPSSSYLDLIINNIQLDLRLTNTLQRYKEFIYTGDNLTQIDIWNSPLKTTKYYNTLFTYTGDNVTNLQITRISDSFIYNKQLTYDINNNLISINII